MFDWDAFNKSSLPQTLYHKHSIRALRLRWVVFCNSIRNSLLNRLLFKFSRTFCPCLFWRKHRRGDREAWLAAAISMFVPSKTRCTLLYPSDFLESLFWYYSCLFRTWSVFYLSALRPTSGCEFKGMSQNLCSKFLNTPPLLGSSSLFYEYSAFLRALLFFARQLLSLFCSKCVS